MKQKLDHPSEWHCEGPDILSKFYDWELLKTFNSALSMGEHHNRSRSEKRQRASAGSVMARMPSRERIMSDSMLEQLVGDKKMEGGEAASAMEEHIGDGKLFIYTPKYNFY
jgi:hypothetical protein